MPVYTYRCANCEHQFDAFQSFSEEALKACPVCGQEALHKVYKPARVIFKGSGFYATDNRSASRVTGGSANGKSESAGSEEQTSTGEKKGEAKAKTGEKSSKPAKKSPSKD